ncbi:MAG: ATP-binding cassette domain-containing protein [Actinomycetota bacterium]
MTSSSGRVLAGPVDLRLEPSSVTALVAASGGGKSLICRSLVGDVPADVSITGSRTIGGTELTGLDRRRLRALRRRQVAYVGQDPGSALNPAATVESLLTELAHPTAPSAAELMDTMLLDTALLKRRSVRLSGGQQRRVAMARAMSRGTPLLILDEPLAGLHQDLRGVIVEVIRRWASERQVAVLITVHTADVAAEFTDRIVHLAPPTSTAPQPTVRSSLGGAAAGEPVLVAAGLDVTLDGHPVLRGVGLECRPGTALAVMGDSGAGKTTLARTLTGQVTAEAGTVSVANSAVPQPIRKRSRAERLAIQLIPQNPLATLDPRRTVGFTLRRAARVRGSESVAGLLERVSLDAGIADRYPHQLSGGQRQRVSIARALAYAPKVLVCDEITSALDPAAEEAVMAVLHREMEARGMAVVLITHDADLAARHCSGIVRLDDGRLIAG